MYIVEMPKAKQDRIKRELTKALKKEGYKGYFLNELVQEGMSGKLSDIDDIVNVKRYH